MTYKEYIQKCKVKETPFNQDIDNFTIDINGENIGISLPEKYVGLVNKVKGDFEKRIDNKEYKSSAKGIASLINDATTLDGAIQLGQFFAKELSDKLYGSPVLIERIHPYAVNKTDAKRMWSWKWHYDNCAPGMIKVMVFLNETTSENGAMSMIYRESDSKVPIVSSSKISPKSGKKTKYPNSRVPSKVINSYIKRGFKEVYLEGNIGDFIVFNTNIIHRGNIPIKEPGRKCIIYLFRPVSEEIDGFIDKDITIGWETPDPGKNYKLI